MRGPSETPWGCLTPLRLNEASVVGSRVLPARPYHFRVSASRPLVVGFDLDMTLIDTRPGFAACLDALAQDTGVTFDVAGMVERLAPPLDLLLRPYFPEASDARIHGLVDRFRELYPATAVGPTRALPGAHEALAAVRA